MKYRRNRTLRPARVIVAAIVALISGAAVSATAQAQTPIYPARPVTVVVHDYGRWRPIPLHPDNRRRGITIMQACMDTMTRP